jgi:hypothetical protein
MSKFHICLFVLNNSIFFAAHLPQIIGKINYPAVVITSGGCEEVKEEEGKMVRDTGFEPVTPTVSR